MRVLVSTVDGVSILSLVFLIMGCFSYPSPDCVSLGLHSSLDPSREEGVEEGHYDPLSSHEIDGVRKEKERLTAVTHTWKPSRGNLYDVNSLRLFSSLVLSVEARDMF